MNFSKVIFFSIFIPIETLGNSTLKINEDVYNIITHLQNVFTDTTNKPLK